MIKEDPAVISPRDENVNISGEALKEHMGESIQLKDLFRTAVYCENEFPYI